MKTIKYNPTLALSILLASYMVRDNAELQVETSTSNTDDDLEKQFRKTYRDNRTLNLDTNYAVSLLKDESLQNSPSKRGSDLARGITARYHDIRDFDSQSALNEIFSGNREAIRMATDTGAHVAMFESSPSSRTQKLSRVTDANDDELNGARGSLHWENDDKDRVIFNPHPLGKWMIINMNDTKGIEDKGLGNTPGVIGETGISDVGYDGNRTDTPSGSENSLPTDPNGPTGDTANTDDIDDDISGADGTDGNTGIGRQGSDVQGDVGIASSEQAPDTKTVDNTNTSDVAETSRKPEGRKKTGKKSVSSDTSTDANPLNDDSIHVENNVTAGTDGVAEQDTGKPSDLSEQNPVDGDITENTDKKF